METLIVQDDVLPEWKTKLEALLREQPSSFCKYESASDDSPKKVKKTRKTDGPKKTIEKKKRTTTTKKTKRSKNAEENVNNEDLI